MIHFKRSEFSCKCGCGFDTVDFELAIILDDVREYFNKPTIITSGCRCEKHNKAVGGADKSIHKEGKAADIKVLDINPIDVYNYLDKKYSDTFGLGLYSTWVHIDSRKEKSRWGKTNLMKGGN
jgi:uncharacterized protein YcbK (DUF882 family)